MSQMTFDADPIVLAKRVERLEKEYKALAILNESLIRQAYVLTYELELYFTESDPLRSASIGEVYEELNKLMNIAQRWAYDTSRMVA